MSLVINTNTIANIAARNLSTNQANLNKSLARLSSGSKLTQSSDDAGGLAVSTKLMAAINRNIRAQQNVQNSLSFLQVQEGALKEAASILDRMSELKTMALDPTKNSSDIENYNTEFMQLQAQLGNIKSEKFNDISLFDSTKSLETKTTEDGETGAVSLSRSGLFDKLSETNLTQQTIANAAYVGTDGTDYTTLTITTPTHGLSATVTLADGVVTGSVNGSDIRTAIKGINDALSDAGITTISASESADGRLVISGSETYQISEVTSGAYGGLGFRQGEVASSTVAITSSSNIVGTDTLNITINGNSLAAAITPSSFFIWDAAEELKAAIDADATLSGIVDVIDDGRGNLTLYSKSGASLTTSLEVAGTVAGSTTDGITSTKGASATVTFAGTAIAGNEFDVALNGTVFTYTSAGVLTSAADEAAALKTAIEADAAFSALVDVTDDGGGALTLTAKNSVDDFVFTTSAHDTIGGAAGTTLTVSGVVGRSTYDSVVKTHDYNSLADYNVGDVVTGTRENGVQESFLISTAVTGNGRTFDEFAALSNTTRLDNSLNPGAEVWTSDGSYAEGDVVYDDRNGRYYVARTATGAATSEKSDYLELGHALPSLSDYAAFDSSKQYFADDIVSYDGSLFMATPASTPVTEGEGSPLDNTADWTRLNVSVTGTFNNLLESNNDIHDFSIADLKQFIQAAATARAENGAQQYRLNTSYSMLQTNHTNLEAANSKLADVDVATESTAFARANILVQSAASMLAQANASQNVALSLLQ